MTKRQKQIVDQVTQIISSLPEYEHPKNVEIDIQSVFDNIVFLSMKNSEPFTKEELEPIKDKIIKLYKELCKL